MAAHLGVSSFVANRLEYREGLATGRLVAPVVRPRGPLAWIADGPADGRVAREQLLRSLGWSNQPEVLEEAEQSVERPRPAVNVPVALFGEAPRAERLSVRETLAGRHILLIGVTGFIGKVWVVKLLEDVSRIGKITLLIRRSRTTSAQRRFEKIVEESPVMDELNA